MLVLPFKINIFILMMQKKDIPLFIRRRLKDVHDDFIFQVDELDPCDYKTVGDYISAASGYGTSLLIDSLVGYDITLKPHQKDNIYFYFLDKFGKKLSRKYDMFCGPE
jgi:hypothetical protein